MQILCDHTKTNIKCDQCSNAKYDLQFIESQMYPSKGYKLRHSVYLHNLHDSHYFLVLSVPGKTVEQLQLLYCSYIQHTVQTNPD